MEDYGYVQSDIKTAWTMALFRDSWAEIASHAGPTIKSLASQQDQGFIVDVAYDKLEVRNRLIYLFNEHAPNIINNKRLILTPLELPENGELIDNNQVAFQRFGHYFEGRRQGINHLFAGDLDDKFLVNYVTKMLATLEAGTPVAIANQITFDRKNPKVAKQPIQSQRFERDSKFGLEQILDRNIAGFCNTAINLNASCFDSTSHYILAKATNKQLDRAFYAAAFARGGYGVLSYADFEYEGANGIYGQGRTPLDVELNMQMQLTRLLSGLSSFSDSAKGMISERNKIDEALIDIRENNPELYRIYQDHIVTPYVETLEKEGKPLLWGEQVRRATRIELDQIKRGQDNNFSPQVA